MDSNLDTESTVLSHANTPRPEEGDVTDLDEVVANLQQEVAAWCGTRPDASNLGIEEVYNELSRLDIREQSLFASKEPGFDQSSWQSKPVGLVLEGDEKAAVQGSFAPRRQLLRSRAMDISRSGIRALKITDLPLDVLRIVFSHFEDDVITEGRTWGCTVAWDWYKAEATEDRRTIRSLRLVCRAFWELATPLLLPVLQVHLNQSSLDLAEKVAHKPAIAAGVRGIRVSLSYRPKEIADDITRYLHLRLSLLQKEEGYYSWQYEPYVYGGMDDSEDGEECGEDGEETEAAWLRRALDNCRLLRQEWQKYVRADDRDETPNEALPEQQLRFREGYAEFCRLQREQERLLQHATFATALASAVARMPNARSLAFVDSPGPHANLKGESLLTDLATVPLYLPRPLEWRTIEEHNENPERPAAGLECARVLWELPISLHRAGVALTEVRITNLPLYNHFSMLFPKDDTGAPLYEELSAACAGLEVFGLSASSHKGIRPNYLPEQDQSYFDGFLGAILARCSHHLRILDLDFYSLSINSGRGGQRSEGGFPSNAFVARLQELPRLRQLRLSHVEVQYDTFKRLCSSMGHTLERLHLYDVYLHNGPWRDVIEVLRQKLTPVAARRDRGDWHLEISDLHGDEFAAFDRKRASSESRWRSWRSYTEDSNPLDEEIGKYLLGELDRNPLRDEGPGKGPPPGNGCTCAYGPRYPCVEHI